MQKRSRRVMVVDDEDIIRDIIRRKILSSTDIVVLEAFDGQDALEKLIADPVDLVITDIRMPRMTGLELITALRDRGLDIPVIIVTGFGTMNDAIKAISLGAVNFIKKPFQTLDLLSVIDRVFAVYEEKTVLRDVLSYVVKQDTVFSLANDVSLFQGMIAYVNETIRNCWTECRAGSVELKICVYEALLNAYEHGNLAIDSDMRETLQNDSRDAYNKLVEERLSTDPYAQKKIRVHVSVDPDSALIEIEDEGDGFDVGSLPDYDRLDEADRNFGRGLLLIRSIMNEVAFNEKGNKITMRLKRSR